MKTIVIVNQTTGYLTIDVANAFKEQYDDVVLISGSISDIHRLDKRIIIHHIIEYNRSSITKRLFTWILATIQISYALLFKYRKEEICFFTNPPTSYFPALLMGKRDYRIVVYDLFPDSLNVIKISEENFIYKLWSKINRKVFSNATRLITLSNTMKDGVSQYVEKSRIEIIPNWASREYCHIDRQKNSFLINNRWNDKFIVLYSGNLGFGYNMDVLIDVADKLKTCNEIHFVVIGEGGKKQLMIEKTQRLELNNVTFLPYQPTEQLNNIFTSAGISVVALGDNPLDVSMPSKTYDLIAARSPLLCIGGKTSELAAFIKEHKNGECHLKNEIEEMAKFILRCCQDHNFRNMLSNNSQKASLLYTKENAKKYV